MENVIKILSSQLPGRVSTPGTAAYAAALSSYNSVQERQLSPSCIVFPESAAEVSTAVTILTKHDAIFAVTGGGYMPHSGAANIGDGVTISLRRMNSVAVNVDHSIVSVGGGAKWNEVAAHLDPLGLAVSGGRVVGVGVGGLTLGGGISFFSGEHGFVCDNVTNFEVVLASGDIINANAKDNSDLWRALKGGSGNFGIVTRFDLKSFTMGRVYGGIIISRISAFDDQLKAFVMHTENYDPCLSLMLTVAWAADTNSFKVVTPIVYTKPVTDSVSVKNFTRVQPQLRNTLRVMSVSEAMVESAALFKNGARIHWATTTFRTSFAMIKTVYEIWKASTEEVASINGIEWPFSIQPLSASYSRESAKKGGNSLGLGPEDGALVIFVASAVWKSQSDDEVVGRAVQNLIANIDHATREAGTFHRFKYLNYAAPWQNPLQSYGEVNLVHLQEMAKKYDPERVFQTSCPGGFKLPRHLSTSHI